MSLPLKCNVPVQLYKQSEEREVVALFVLKYLKNEKCFPLPQQRGTRVKRMREIMARYATACKDDTSVLGKVTSSTFYIRSIPPR